MNSSEMVALRTRTFDGVEYRVQILAPDDTVLATVGLRYPDKLEFSVWDGEGTEAAAPYVTLFANGAAFARMVAADLKQPDPQLDDDHLAAWINAVSEGFQLALRKIKNLQTVG
jgi:hypothetical protein